MLLAAICNCDRPAINMNAGARVYLYSLDALLGGKRPEKWIGLVAFHQVNPTLHWQILVSVICLNDLRPSSRTMLKPWQRETHSYSGVYVVGLPVPYLSTVSCELTGGRFVNLLWDLELRLSFVLEVKTLKTGTYSGNSLWQFTGCVGNATWGYRLWLFTIMRRLIISCAYRREDAVAELCVTLRRLMSYIYGAPILDVSRSHTTTQHSR